MYVIGESDFSFVKIKEETLYDGQNVWREIRTAEYKSPLNSATIVPTYKAFKKKPIVSPSM